MILLAFRVLLLAAALLVLAPLHKLAQALVGSHRFATIFLGLTGFIFGLRIRREGPRPPANALLVANHVSWLDIMALGSAAHTAFVAKAEVGDHWLIRWLSDCRDTLYIRREKRRDAGRQAQAVRDRFAHALPLAIFAEGTTNDGTFLHPFRPSLFAAATPPPEGAKVIPVAIDYGPDAAAIAWHGEEGGLANVVRILKRTRPIPVTIRMLPPLDTGLDRKTMAREAHLAVADALGLQPAA